MFKIRAYSHLSRVFGCVFLLGASAAWDGRTPGAAAALGPDQISRTINTAGLHFGFVGDYVPCPASKDPGGPARVVYRRGAQVCLNVGWAPPPGDTRQIVVEATGDAVLRTAGGVTRLPLVSDRVQTITPTPGRAVSLQLVFAALPDRILRGRLEIPVRVSLGADRVREGIALDLNTVEAHPLVPPTVDGLDVLDEAASYAQGASGMAAVASAVTAGLYGSGRFRYDDAHSVRAFDSARGSVRLGLLRAGRDPLPVNCYQVSGYLTCLLGALGVETEWREIVLEPAKTGDYHFSTMPVAPIGSSLKERASYRPLRMFSHQFVLVDGRVYDATYAALDGPDGKPWRRPITRWTLSTYLGVPAGRRGRFVAGVDERGTKRAFLRVGYGALPPLGKGQAG